MALGIQPLSWLHNVEKARKSWKGLKIRKMDTNLRRAASFLAASILLAILFLLALIRSSCFSWLTSHKVEAVSRSPLEGVDFGGILDFLGFLASVQCPPDIAALERILGVQTSLVRESLDLCRCRNIWVCRIWASFFRYCYGILLPVWSISRGLSPLLSLPRLQLSSDERQTDDSLSARKICFARPRRDDVQYVFHYYNNLCTFIRTGCNTYPYRQKLCISSDGSDKYEQRGQTSG